MQAWEVEKSSSSEISGGKDDLLRFWFMLLATDQNDFLSFFLILQLLLFSESDDLGITISPRKAVWFQKTDCSENFDFLGLAKFLRTWFLCPSIPKQILSIPL